MNILEQLRDILMIKGFLTNVTIGDLQTDNDSCISLFQLSGTRQKYFGGGKIDDQTVRILIRNKSYKNGLEDIEKVKNVLNNYKDDNIINTIIKSLDTFMGKDDKRRNVWEITYLIRY